MERRVGPDDASIHVRDTPNTDRKFSAPVRKLAGRTIPRSGSSTVSVNPGCQAVNLSTCQGVKLNFDQLQLAAPRAAAPRMVFCP